MRLQVLAVTFCLMSSGPLNAETGAPITAALPIQGHWEGLIKIRPAQFEVDFSVDLARRADGTLGGELSFLTQEQLHQPLQQVTLEGDNITFIVRDESDGVVSTFRGWVSDDGQRIDGDLTEKGQHYLFALHRGGEPATSQELRRLTASGAELKSIFNRDRGQVRLLVILSPTCPMCRNGARLIQRYVLERVRDPRLSVYVVWERINPDDSEAKAMKSAALITGPRVAQFWSDHRFTGEAFQAGLGYRTSPAWDVFLLFAPTERWVEASSPAPVYVMSNLAIDEEKAHAHPRLDATKLAERIETLLGESYAPGPKAGSR